MEDCDEDPFNNVQVKPRGGIRNVPAVVNHDDFQVGPVRPRGALKAVVVPDTMFNQENIDSELKEEESDEDYDLGPVRPRGVVKPLIQAACPDKSSFQFNGGNEEKSPGIGEKVSSPIHPVSAIGDEDTENIFGSDACIDQGKMTGKASGNPAKAVKFNLPACSPDVSASLSKSKDASLSDASFGNSTLQDFGVGDEQFQPGESAAFMDDLSFLEQFGDNDEESAKRAEELARKSLYVRFDPLVKPDRPGKASDSVSPAGSGGSTGDLFMRGSPAPSAAANLAARLQAVKEASKSSSVSSPKSNQYDYIDANNPFSPAKTPQSNSSQHSSGTTRLPFFGTPHDKGLVEPLLYTQSDLDEVVRVREEEWKKRYEDLNSRIKEEVAMRELLEQDNRDKVAAIRKENIEMKHVVEEYEKTIVQLTENSHHANLNTEATLAETLRAKEQLQQELHSTEANLVDAYKRVEKLKQVIDTYKQNEDLLKQSLNDFQDKLKRSEERYQALKKQAAEKVDAANVEINKVRKQKEVDLAGLEAALRMANSRISSLEQDVAQKVRANQELTSICDELIKKVSGET